MERNTVIHLGSTPLNSYSVTTTASAPPKKQVIQLTVLPQTQPTDTSKFFSTMDVLLHAMLFVSFSKSKEKNSSLEKEIKKAQKIEKKSLKEATKPLLFKQKPDSQQNKRLHQPISRKLSKKI